MSVSKQFVLAGDATFTVELPKGDPNGSHLTYRVQHIEANDRWPESYFVKILRGPDNTSDYVYLGKLDPFTGQVRSTERSAYAQDSFPVRLINRVLVRIWADDHAAYEQFGYQTHHEGRCGRCNRKLTVPESITSGIGPECAKKVRS